MQESFWRWQCSDRYIISLSPHLHTPFPSRTVSVDVKYHVYLLTYRGAALQAKFMITYIRGDNYIHNYYCHRRKSAILCEPNNKNKTYITCVFICGSRTVKSDIFVFETVINFLLPMFSNNSFSLLLLHKISLHHSPILISRLNLREKNVLLISSQWITKLLR